MSDEEYLKIIEDFKRDNKELTENKNRKKIKSTFLQHLPHSKSGKQILWRKCVGYNVYFIYENIEGWIEIVGYNKSNQTLTIKYKNKEFDIKTSHFYECRLGVLLEKIITEFRYKIGQRIIDYNKDKSVKRDFTITDKIRKKNNVGDTYKYYQYTCNLCGFDSGRHWNCKESKYRNEFWILESGITKGSNCVCCCVPSKIMVEGINDIPTTAPWMVKYFQGGYNEAKLYTRSSNQKIYPVCPDCGRMSLKSKIINNLYKNHSIGCICSDKIPYGEKIMYSVLEQFQLNFTTQLTKTTFKWCKDYRYDFYFELNNEQFICEVNGLQHYEQNNNFKMTLNEQIENDRLKKELALKYGVKPENYIVIDCRYSELEWIKEHILNSKLAEVFDLSNIDWNICEEFACCNLVKIACEYKKDDIKLSCIDISKIMKYSPTTVTEWIKTGIKVGFFDNGIINSNIIDINLIKIQLKHLKPTLCFETRLIFESIISMSYNSEKIFGVKLKKVGISRVARGERKQYKGFTFKYVEDLTIEEYVKYNVEEQLKQIQKNAKLNQAI